MLRAPFLLGVEGWTQMPEGAMVRSQERAEQPDSKLLPDWHRPLVPGTSLRLEAPPTHTPLGASASKAAEPHTACVLLHPVSSLACHRSLWDLWRVVGKSVPPLAGPWRYSRHQTSRSKRLVAGEACPGAAVGSLQAQAPRRLSLFQQQ